MKVYAAVPTEAVEIVAGNQVPEMLLLEVNGKAPAGTF